MTRRIVAVLVIGFTGTAAADEPIRLDARRQLFLDDYLIESMSNVQRRIQPARKYPGNPVLWKTEPWEDDLNVLYGSVIRDNGKYRMWYKEGQGVGYAESEDGIAWVKPQFDLVLDDGRRTNRLFVKREKFLGPEHLPTFWEPFGVFRDDRDPDPARRFKMGFLSIIRPYSGPRADPFHPTDRRGLGVAGSPDGIHWTLIEAFATEAICDGATHWMLDPARDNYVLYGRTKKTLPEVESAWSGFDWYEDWHSGRAVARVESKDFLHWDFTDPATAPVVLTADAKDEPGAEICAMKVFPYEGIYTGLVQSFLARPDAAWLDVHLAVSRDSLHFAGVGDGITHPAGIEGAEEGRRYARDHQPPRLGDDRCLRGAAVRHRGLPLPPHEGPGRRVPRRPIDEPLADRPSGHVIAEFYADGRWAMADTSWFCVFPAADGHLMSAAECHRGSARKRLVGEAYVRRGRALLRLSDERLVGGHFLHIPEENDRKGQIARKAASVRRELAGQQAESVGERLWAFGVMNYPLPR